MKRLDSDTSADEFLLNHGFEVSLSIRLSTDSQTGPLDLNEVLSLHHTSCISSNIECSWSAIFLSISIRHLHCIFFLLCYILIFQNIFNNIFAKILYILERVAIYGENGQVTKNIIIIYFTFNEAFSFPVKICDDNIFTCYHILTIQA